MDNDTALKLTYYCGYTGMVLSWLVIFAGLLIVFASFGVSQAIVIAEAIGSVSPQVAANIILTRGEGVIIGLLFVVIGFQADHTFTLLCKETKRELANVWPHQKLMPYS